MGNAIDCNKASDWHANHIVTILSIKSSRLLTGHVRFGTLNPFTASSGAATVGYKYHNHSTCNCMRYISINFLIRLWYGAAGIMTEKVANKHEIIPNFCKGVDVGGLELDPPTPRIFQMISVPMLFQSNPF